LRRSPFGIRPAGPGVYWTSWDEVAAGGDIVFATPIPASLVIDRRRRRGPQPARSPEILNSAGGNARIGPEAHDARRCCESHQLSKTFAEYDPAQKEETHIDSLPHWLGEPLKRVFAQPSRFEGDKNVIALQDFQNGPAMLL
jgi:hypothetical protein